MSKRTQIILALLGIILVAGLAYVAAMQMGLGDIGGDAAPTESAHGERDLADMTPGERLCADQSTVDDMRRRIFTRARAATEGDAAALSRLESGTIARIEDPRLVDYDEGLERAECEGLLVLDLPRGTEPAFNYNRRLSADLRFFAEPGMNGQGRVSRMSGADMVIDRLASADLVERHDSGRADRGDESEDPETKPEDLLPEPGLQEQRPAAPGQRPRPPSGEAPEDLVPPAMQEGEGQKP